MRFLLYGLIRIVVFVGVWYLCMAMDLGMVLSVLVALILSFAVGYLGLRRLRDGATEDMAAWRRGVSRNRRGRTEQADAEAEDAYTEGRFRS
ncbi:DUF4229 domain-containing protein [Micrococcus lylae]|uniref:DUF4229 domain-containing protein n=1 Tax=Micrococcus lylae TaxID=1273 RepID=A0A1R4IXJ8_9MICC|nr:MULTISPECIES: DUF4229 domain-containing protein [Micrococcus]PNL18573.1 DUF4229 domain-containing protein [Micrococcus sp. FDAARGOS_333]SJN24560.1 hypothetical protein FM125_05185 [Micrococcus lylae]